MNKRFSTLLATALVAGGVSVNAQAPTSVTKIETSPARNYVLETQSSASYLTVIPSGDGMYVQEQVIATTSTAADAQLWTMKVKAVAGSNRFIMTNNATGLTLSFDPANAIKADATGAVALPADNAVANKAAALDKDAVETEWTWVANKDAAELNSKVALTCAFTTDSTMSVACDASGWLYAYKYANDKTPTLAGGLTQLTVQAMQPGTVVMKEADLNVLGTAVKYFTLGTSKTGIQDAGQLIGRKFHAEDKSVSSDYVYLRNLKADGTLEDNLYAMVDTAYWDGTASNKDMWYRFNNKKWTNELDNSYLFKFERDLFKDSVIVSVQAVALLDKQDAADVDGSWWNNTNVQTENDDYLVVSAVQLTKDTEVLTLFEVNKTENLLFSVSKYVEPVDETLASVKDGVYFIKNDKGQYLANPIYKAQKDYTATVEWVTVNADEQAVAHMPAYQWIVLKDNTKEKYAEVSPVSIYNREFNMGNTADYASIQLHADEAAEFMYAAGLNADSLDFDPVPAVALGDTLLGYKNFEANDILVKRYTFNYLHAYADDKFLGKSAKDSLATVLNGKVAFEVEAEGEIAPYGFEVTDAVKDRIEGLKQLYRQAYKVLVPAKKDMYLGYNEEAKFAITAETKGMTATTFWFKENNDLPGDDNCYHAMIVVPGDDENYSKAGVTDDDLSATLKHQVYSETRTSAFLIAPYDAPLYRRFNSAELEGAGLNDNDEADTLRFVEKYRNEYLQVEANENFKKDGIKFLGIYTPDFTKDGKSFIVDTAFVNRWNGQIKPQYLISINREDQKFEPGTRCPICQKYYEENGKYPEGKCIHDEEGKLGFHFGEYLVNFADSVENATANKADYAWKGYTRAGFVKAAHQGDSLFILTGQFADWKVADFDSAEVKKAVKDGKYLSKYIVDLTEDAHKYVTWSMRFVNPEVAANDIEDDRAFLMESMAAEGENAIAPTFASWLKMQNGCIVMSGTAGDNGINSSFNQFTQDDDALIFNVRKGNKEDMATDNESIEATGVSVVATEGAVIVKGAEGKNVVITNVLGQTIANTVVTSSEATISAPAGVVVVAVEGEAAVKAIVK